MRSGSAVGTREFSIMEIFRQARETDKANVPW